MRSATTAALRVCVALSLTLTLTGTLLSAGTMTAAAETSPSIDPAVAQAALFAAATASAKAAANGWKATVTGQTDRVFITSDTLHRRVHETHDGQPLWETFAADGVGMYERLTPTTALTAALKELNRPAAQFRFTPDKNYSLSDARGSDAYDAPTGDLGPVGTLKAIAVTSAKRYVQDDGTQQYSFTGSLRGIPAAASVYISLDGTISGTSMKGGAGTGAIYISHQFSYTDTEVTLSSAAISVSGTALDRAVYALTLPATLKAQAKSVAVAADKRAKNAGRRTTTATDIDRAAGLFVILFTKYWHPIATTTKVTRTGATLSVVNPYTRRTLTYAVIVVNGKAAVRT